MGSITMPHTGVRGVSGNTMTTAMVVVLELSIMTIKPKRRREKKYIVSIAGANQRIKRHETEVFEEKLSSHRKGNKRSRANSW